MEMPILEQTTPSLQCYKSVPLWKNEDSGYNTSFTPGSTEHSRILNDSPIDPSPKIVITGHIHVTKTNINFQLDRHKHSTTVSSPIKYAENSTPIRRGVKRPYEEDVDVTASCEKSIATPTSIIANEIQKLEVNDTTSNLTQYFIPFASTSVTSDYHSQVEQEHNVAYPTTPVKKICRSSCKLLSPLNRKRFGRKVEFAIHSLTCDKNALQPMKYANKPKSKVGKFRPEQKIDIITLLCDIKLPLLKILGYLSNEDIYNFTLVSDTWRLAWENIREQNPRKREYTKYWNAVNTNQENWENGVVPKLPDINHQLRPLREIDNDLKIVPQSSAPNTPRTNKFKKFTRAASMDSRMQLSCAQCQYPAKVTKELSGEQWAECTNVTCAYQFCKLCKSKRHQGTTCMQYDLNEPSPPKRKKNLYAVSSKKSKKNLYRLLDQCKNA